MEIYNIHFQTNFNTVMVYKVNRKKKHLIVLRESLEKNARLIILSFVLLSSS